MLQLYPQVETAQCVTHVSIERTVSYSLVSLDIVFMRTNIVNLLNRVAEHDCQTFFVLHRTTCKAMHFEWEHFSDVTLTLNPNSNPNRNHNRNPVQNALVYISFCVSRKKSA